MKKLIINCLATTALTLLTLAVIASLYNARFLFVASVFQAFFANAVIHAGLVLVRKFDSKFFFVELLAEIGYTLAILILCGVVFDWYSSTPLWIVIVMGIMIYLTACILGVIKIKSDISYINNELKKRIESNNTNYEEK